LDEENEIKGKKLLSEDESKHPSSRDNETSAATTTNTTTSNTSATIAAAAAAAADHHHHYQQQQQQQQQMAPLDSSIKASLSVCAGCQHTITEHGLEALSKKWHVQCFVCTVCRKPLSGSFLHRDGNPYCAEDFHKLFSKVCNGCGKVIQGQFLKALNKEWHVSGCFVCSKCDCSLINDFVERKGKNFCKNCA